MNGIVRNSNDLGHRVDSAANDSFADVHYHCSSVGIRWLGFQPEQLAEIDNRNDGAAKVRHPLYVVGNLRCPGDLPENDDLLDLANRKGIGLILYPERNKLRYVPRDIVGNDVCSFQDGVPMTNTRSQTASEEAFTIKNSRNR